MKVKYGTGLGAKFLSEPFKTEIEERLSRVDSCGHSVCVEVFPSPPDAITLMLRKSAGGPFPNTPTYKEFVFDSSAYEGNERELNKARADLEDFVEKIQHALREEQDG